MKYEPLDRYEPAVQDGYSFRATEVWPAGQEPYRGEDETSGASGAVGEDPAQVSTYVDSQVSSSA